MNLRKFSNSKEENKFVFLNGKKNIKLKLKEKYWLKKPFVKKRIAVRVVRKGKVVFSALRSHFEKIFVYLLNRKALKSALDRKILSERISAHIAGLADKGFFFQCRKDQKSKIQIQKIEEKIFEFFQKIELKF